MPKETTRETTGTTDMPNVNFYLKKAEQSTNRSLIILQMKYKARRLVFSTGESVEPSNWNEGKQRVKGRNITTKDDKHLLNDLLDNLETVLLKAYNKELPNGVPQPDTLKKYLSDFVNQNEETAGQTTLHVLLDRFICGEIKSQGEDKSANTLKTYKTLKGHLTEFESVKKIKIDFDAITLDFYYKYVDFLKNRDRHEKDIRRLRPDLKNKPIKGLDPNSIGKDIQILKVVMGEAVDQDLTENLQFKHKKFFVIRKDTDAVYLTVKEIMKLYKYDFSANKKLENVRDLFVFGCFTGLRFSDYSNVKPENIISEDGEFFVKMRTKKTDDLVIIPTNPIILEIFEKYKHNPNRLPKSISIQKFNDYVKEACRVAGLVETGRLSKSMDLQLWESISSHTCRRSFASNYYLEGFPTIDLMKITGHTTERSFMKYIKVTKLTAAKNLSKHIKKNWGQLIMRVAS